jgi:hypothetical protein
VRVEDKAGNQGAPSTAFTLTVDTTAPDLSGATVSIDQVTGDNIINSVEAATAKTTLTGKITNLPGDAINPAVTVTLDGTHYNATVTGQTWSVEVDTSVLTGSTSKTVNATLGVTDSAGNSASIDAVPQHYTLDTNAVSIHITTPIAGDDIVNLAESQLPVTISGTTSEIEAGQLVHISVGSLTSSAVVLAGGSWSVAMDLSGLPDGASIPVTAEVSNQAGSPAHASADIAKDTVGPSTNNTVAITAYTDDVEPATGNFGNGTVTNDKLPKLGGTVSGLENGDTVEIFQGNVHLGSATVNGGVWFYQITQELADETYTYQAVITDHAGNPGTASNTFTLTVDTIAPTQTTTITAINDDVEPVTGVVADQGYTNDTAPHIAGTISIALGAHEVVAVYRNDERLGTATVTSTSWTYNDSGLADGQTYTYTARVEDQASNHGAFSSAYTITIDTTQPPSVPTIESYTDDVGKDQGNFPSGTTTDDRQPVLNGTLNADIAPGEHVAIYEGTTLIGTATMDAGSARDWSFELPSLADGSTHTYTARVIDLAGNEGDFSNNFTLKVELEVIVNSQNTLDTTPIITGSTGFHIMPGEYVDVTINGVTYSSKDGAVVVDLLNNTWYIQIPDPNALPTGQHYDVVAELKDASGAVITHDKTLNELYVSAPPQPPSAPPTDDPDNKATAMTIGETGGWRIFANQTIFDANGTDSTSVTSLKANILTGNSGVLGSATFIDFDRDGLMDIIGADSQYQDGQQGYKYIPGSSQTLTSANAYGASNIGKTNVDYEAFQMGWPGQPNDYAGTASVKYSGVGPDGSTSTEYSANAFSWYGGVAGYDKGGDGYVDVIFGDNTPNDNEARGGYDTSFIVNNHGIFNKDPSLVYDATGAPRNNWVESRQATPEKVVSTVDLNNDGMVDLVYGGNAGTNFISARGDSATNRTGNNARLVVASDDGSGNLKVVQIVENMLYDREGTVFDGQSMTWADFDGDGYLDLFQSVGYGANTAAENISRIYFNDAGRISAATTNAGGYQTGAGRSYSMTYTSDAPVMKGGGSLAVDWNADGKMDIIETPYYATTNPGTSGFWNVLLYTNQTADGLVKFDTSVLATAAKQGVGSAISGLLAIDLDWDGDKDLILFTGTKGTIYVENKVQIAYGTAMHVKILDAQGINSLYGNTVQLFDSTGKLVSTQIINPQSGNQTNDSSALVDFYGLDPSQTYSLALLRAVGGQSADVGGLPSLGGNVIENVNAAWTGLQASAPNDCYVFTAEAGNAVNNANIGNGIVGTGYNDTFFATLGTDKYEGGGGTVMISGVTAWSNTGGMDIVDYKLAGNTAVTADLSKTGAQNTGFGTATFSNIEGLSGGSGNDTFTDSTAGGNYFTGRGGNDTFNLIHGGHDTLLYPLLMANDATGGNGSDTVNGWKVGTFEATPKADRIDVSELLTGYTPVSADGYAARFINGTPTINAGDTIASYLRVMQAGDNLQLQIDRDGGGGSFTWTTLLTLNDVHTDLASLLANHQIVVS